MRLSDVKEIMDALTVGGASRDNLLGFGRSDFVGVAASPGAQGVRDDYGLLLLADEMTGEATLAAQQIGRSYGAPTTVLAVGSFALDSATDETGSDDPSDGVPCGLRAGDSIGPFDGVRATGTLGTFVRTREGATALMSNAHVLAPRHGRPGGHISSPGPGDGPRSDVGVVAQVLPINGGVRDPIDAALATLLPGVIPADPVPANHRCIDPLTIGAGFEVAKTGRTTGTTSGTVVGVDGRIFDVAYPTCRVTLTGLILIEGSNGDPFTKPGDSGAMVVEASTGAPVGLHVGSNRVGQTRQSFCHPLVQVLEALNASLWDGLEDQG